MGLEGGVGIRLWGSKLDVISCMFVFVVVLISACVYGFLRWFVVLLSGACRAQRGGMFTENRTLITEN